MKDVEKQNGISLAVMCVQSFALGLEHSQFPGPVTSRELPASR